MKYVWKDLPKDLNCFTVRNSTMRNLNTGEIIQYYSANTKIVVVQKCITEKGTYYRTRPAEHQNLNWAFEASALGLPNEKAPSAHLTNSIPYSLGKKKLASRTPSPEKKQTRSPKPKVAKDGEPSKKPSLWKKLFRKK